MKLTVRQIRDLERDLERLASIIKTATFEDSYDGSEASNIVKRLENLVAKFMTAEVDA